MRPRASFWFGSGPLVLALCCAPAQPSAPSSALPRGPASSSPAQRAAADASAKPAAESPAARAPAGAIGTRHPVALEASAPDGSWVVLCQARQDTDGNGQVQVRVGPQGELLGDRLQSYLVFGSGAGEAIDELAAVDPKGRWLVLRRQGRLVLVDTRSRAETNLSERGADAQSDSLAYRPHRAVSFDAHGSRLLYVRQPGKSSQVVVRHLQSGTETTIDPGVGVVWRAELDAGGGWVVLRMLVDDTNGNGRLDWPVPPADKSQWRCAGPIPKLSAWLGRGDTPTVKVAPSRGGTAKVVPGFVAPFGDALLVREPDGRLLLRRSNTKRQQLADAKCAARVVHADPRRKLVVAACSAAPGRPPVRLVGPGYSQELKLEIAPQSHDRWPRAEARLLPIYSGADTALLDLDRRVVRPLKPRDAVIATSGRRALVRRRRSLLLYDVETGREQRLAGRTAVLPHVVRLAAIAVVSPLVVDVRAGRLLGEVAGRPLAVTGSGQVLIAQGGDAHAGRLAIGPLRWVDPH